ncbi:MAG: PD-(D/E)XK nuclease family protein [Lentisphaerae bacterium]|nr:PD-(D/E)XK nuclease family protein [Lentisphaerota bacterium]
MAKQLSNDLTWSVSRAQLFQNCQRAYYFNYYGSWGGWDSAAPERTRQLYILKNIKPMVMWAGSIVHDLIKQALEQYSMTRVLPSISDLQNQARRQLRQGWTESVSQAWRTAPKKTNLHELYYGNGKTLPREDTDRIKARVYDSLEAFVNSATLKAILTVPFVQWKPIDILDSFQVEEYKVWCAVDFAYTDREGMLHIVDWKTGGENPVTLRQQLACYALYAMDKWKCPVEQLALHGVFLNDGGRRSDYPVDAALLISVKDQILLSVQAMRRKLRDPEQNLAEEEDFPLTENLNACESCVFCEACPRFTQAGV